MDRWQGCVALVTGATSGIGACVVEDLLHAGMKVVGLGRNVQVLEETAKYANARNPGSYHPIPCDLAKEPDILKAFSYIEKHFKTLHVLINCAGILLGDMIIDSSTDKYRRILDVNVLAAVISAREAVRLMRKHGVQGHIINVNSIAGHEAARIQAPVNIYCASKYAMTGVAESLRNELDSVKSGIKLSNISPGPVMTNMIRNLGCDHEVLMDSKILDPQDVSNAILYALSTPPHVEINELKITPLDQRIQNVSAYPPQ